MTRVLPGQRPPLRHASIEDTGAVRMIEAGGEIREELVPNRHGITCLRPDGSEVFVPTTCGPSFGQDMGEPQVTKKHLEKYGKPRVHEAVALGFIPSDRCGLDRGFAFASPNPSGRLIDPQDGDPVDAAGCCGKRHLADAEYRCPLYLREKRRRRAVQEELNRQRPTAERKRVRELAQFAASYSQEQGEHFKAMLESPETLQRIAELLTTSDGVPKETPDGPKRRNPTRR